MEESQNEDNSQAVGFSGKREKVSVNTILFLNPGSLRQLTHFAAFHGYENEPATSTGAPRPVRMLSKGGSHLVLNINALRMDYQGWQEDHQGAEGEIPYLDCPFVAYPEKPARALANANPEVLVIGQTPAAEETSVRAYALGLKSIVVRYSELSVEEGGYLPRTLSELPYDLNSPKDPAVLMGFLLEESLWY